MHICQYWQAGFIPDIGENLKTFFQTRSAKAVDAGAIGLIKASLEHALDAGRFLQFDKKLRNLKADFFAFDHTRPGNDEKITMGAHLNISDVKLFIHSFPWSLV